MADEIPNTGIIKELRAQIHEKDEIIGRLEQEIDTLSLFQNREKNLDKFEQNQKVQALLAEEFEIKHNIHKLEQEILNLEDTPELLAEVQKEFEFVVVIAVYLFDFTHSINNYSGN